MAKLPRVGLAGLGLMGHAMGHALLDHGFTLSVLPNRRRGAALELQAAGGSIAADAQELTGLSDVLILCLPEERACREVLFGDKGIVTTARPGLLVVECSTLTPQAGEEFHARLEALEIDFVDAPLTGGPREAKAGQLQALVGARDNEVAARAEVVLNAFCRVVRRLGRPGRGYAAKLINNFLAFANLVAVAEAMATARKADLDMETLLAAIGDGGGQSRCLNGLGPWITGMGESRSQAHLSTAAKDVDYYSQLAASLEIQGPLSEHVRTSLQRTVEDGFGEEMTSAYLSYVAARYGATLPLKN